LQAVAAGIVACSLVIWCLAGAMSPGIARGQASAGPAQQVLVARGCYILAAIGLIWLSWCWLKAVRDITSIARRLEKAAKQENLRSGSGTVAQAGAKKANGFARALIIPSTGELHEAIDHCLDSHSQVVGQLEKHIKELQIENQLLQRQRRNTEAIIYGIRDAVVVVDEFDRLLMANEAAGKLFGFDFRNAQHERIGQLIVEDKKEFVDFLRQSIQSKARATKREIKFFDGEKPRTFDCIISCVYDQREQVCGVVAVLHDITREKEISQMKNDFVSHVSHELKTPLASITAYAEMLVDGEADDEATRKGFYEVIQGQAKRLSRLIEDILNISRIESGLIKVNKEPVSLTIVIEEQIQMIKGYAEEKDIKIIRQKPIVFDQVYADKDMISQVIVNLLSNAVKYTPCGGQVRIETEVDEIENVARVSVTDTGVGIPEDEVKHVFDKFYRVDANSSQAKGTGLGLNLVKQIIEKVHNGKIFVKSKQGVGSTFGFELPLAKTQVVKAGW
jgi:two-component system phosphate regulon sensor histidine kinase PhoR